MKGLARNILFLFGLALVFVITGCKAEKTAKETKEVKEVKVVGEEVDYASGGITLKGFLAYDSAMKGKRPGVIVVHEWWGHNEYARKRARMLAELGYTALALDMYGEGKQAAHPEDAQKFSSEIANNMDLAKERFNAAVDALKAHESVDPERIAAIGYCFGGSVVLQMARSGADLDAVVSFHGGLATPSPAEPGGVKAKILVCHGEADELIPAGQVEAFKEEMDKAGADYEFISYTGAKHSFTNPEADKYAAEFNIPLAYDMGADRKSWADMQGFLKDVFKE